MQHETALMYQKLTRSSLHTYSHDLRCWRCGCQRKKTHCTLLTPHYGDSSPICRTVHRPWHPSLSGICMIWELLPATLRLMLGDRSVERWSLAVCRQDCCATSKASLPVSKRCINLLGSVCFACCARLSFKQLIMCSWAVLLLQSIFQNKSEDGCS